MTKTALGVLQLCFYYFALYFFNELVIHSSWEAKQRDIPVVGAFTPACLVAFVDDQFANLSVPFQNAMTFDTHESAKSSGVASSPNSYFSQLDLSSDFATASESLLMHSSTEAFTCAKSKHPNWKTLLSSVRSGANVDKGKHHVEIFCLHMSQENSTQRIIFIFWQLLQCGPNSQNRTPYSHCCLTRQPPCFACALQLPTFCLHCSRKHRQASRSQWWNSKALL